MFHSLTDQPFPLLLTTLVSTTILAPLLCVMAYRIARQIAQCQSGGTGFDNRLLFAPFNVKKVNFSSYAFHETDVTQSYFEWLMN